MIDVNGRRYAAPKQPTVVVCVDQKRRWRNFDAFELALNHAL